MSLFLATTSCTWQAGKALRELVVGWLNARMGITPEAPSGKPKT